MGRAFVLLLPILLPTLTAQQRQACPVYLSNTGPRGDRALLPLPPCKEFIVERGWELVANILKFTLC
jgi:hypothetical protein